jgi:hypothetical protein
MRLLRILALAFIFLPLIPVAGSARRYCSSPRWIGNSGHYSYYQYRCYHRHRLRHHRLRSWYHRHLDRD